MDNRRLLLVAALSLAILFGWQLIFPPPEPPQAPEPAPVPASSAAPATPSAPEAPATLPAPGPATPLAVSAADRRGERAASGGGHSRPAGGVHQPRRAAGLLSSQGSQGGRPRGAGARVGAAGRGPIPSRSSTPTVRRWRSTTRSSPPRRAPRVRRAPSASGTPARWERPRSSSASCPTARSRSSSRSPDVEDWAVLLGPGLRNLSAKDLESRFEVRAGVYLYGDEVGGLRRA